ncbi:MAG: histidine kinase [Candidatus Marinimicrobia bacterium]|nr:histidine kinase [Candidatus Neomarinimicrobiota bacterium]MCF7827885.1 histidine kinase [Candidatus Neomarinimicrobiota bacterium]MCF7879360.1 histidine kinase [Candidatus Neomarinimicrobiota bacterium]
MKARETSTKFWLWYHIGLLLFSALMAIVMKFIQQGSVLPVIFPTVFLISESMGYMAIYVMRKSRGYSQQELRKKILPALLLFFVASFLIVNVIVSLGVFGWFVYAGLDLSDFWTHLFRNELATANIRFAFWLLFFCIAFFYILWQKAAKREERLRAENLRYRYNTLKLQVNPHFLFNSLNILSEMEGRETEEYVQKLSGIYRYVLENEKTDFIPLEEELRFARRYFDLHRERDGDKIVLEIDVAETEQYQIIPMSLQILIENALKHNTRSQSNPLRIQISQAENYITVSNNIQRKETLEKSTRTGLSNLRERVRLLMDREMDIREEDNRFIVKLPIRRAAQ